LQNSPSACNRGPLGQELSRIPWSTTWSTRAITTDIEMKKTCRNCLWRQVLCSAGDLGFEPSLEALRRYRSDVANALLSLQIRRNHTAIILNQHRARTGNTFPYFSPAAMGWDRLPSTGIQSGASGIMMKWQTR
jgi:hypothetical protein